MPLLRRLSSRLLGRRPYAQTVPWGGLEAAVDEGADPNRILREAARAQAVEHQAAIQRLLEQARGRRS